MSELEIFPGTLQQALSSKLLAPGTRLYLREGNYTIGDLRPYLSNITLAAYPGEQPILIPAPGYYRALLIQDVHNITLDGLTFDGVNVQECLKITNTSQGIRVTNCEIKNAPSQGILITGTTHNLEIDHCYIHDNGLDHFDHGLYLSSDYAGFVASIHHNTISSNAGHGIHAFNDVGGAECVYSVNANYLADNGEAGIGVYHGHATVYNNIVRAGQRGIVLRYTLVRGEIFYNTVVDATNISLELNTFTGAPEITIQNNRIVGLAGYLNGENTSVTYTNNLIDVGAETVTDNGGADVRPIEASRANGIAIAGITDDYGGNVRANLPTIGAWE